MESDAITPGASHPLHLVTAQRDLADDGGSTQQSAGPEQPIVIELPLEHALPIDTARLLGPVVRGRISPVGLPELVANYRSLQSLGEQLDRNDIGCSEAATALPDFFQSLRADLSRPEVLQLWGASTTVDNGSHQVPLAFLRLIADHRGVPADPTNCHAGLVHTYGYLLSPAETTYGRKRHRWSSQEAAHALGIPGSWPLDGDGILTSLTQALTAAAPLDGDPSPADGSAGPISVTYELDEHGETAGTQWRSRVRVLARPGAPDGSAAVGDELLLVYTVGIDDRPEQYITAFPVSHSAAVEATTAPRRRLRFNAVLTGDRATSPSEH